MAALHAIWVYGDRRWQHIGYTYGPQDAKTIVKVCRHYGPSSKTFASTVSKFGAPKKWDKKWKAIFYKYGPTEWGRFSYPWNTYICDWLRSNFSVWEGRNKMPACTTEGVNMPISAAANANPWLVINAMAAQSCASRGQRARLDKVNNWIDCY